MACINIFKGSTGSTNGTKDRILSTLLTLWCWTSQSTFNQMQFEHSRHVMHVSEFDGSKQHVIDVTV